MPRRTHIASGGDRSAYDCAAVCYPLPFAWAANADDLAKMRQTIARPRRQVNRQNSHGYHASAHPRNTPWNFPDVY